MGDDTYQKILATIGVKYAPPSGEFLAWLAGCKAPQEVLDQFAAGTPLRRRSRVRDRWEFFTEKDIQKEAAEFPRYLKSGVLAIGTCVNGDPIALDLRKTVGAIGYISHDSVWEDDEIPIRKCFVVVALSLAEFACAVRDGSMAIDYYDAKSRK
jgi:hypothetical protein